MNDKSFLFQRQTECHERRVVRFGINECPDTRMFTHIRCCVAKCTLTQHMWRNIYIPSNSLLPVHLFQHHTPTSLKFNTESQFFFQLEEAVWQTFVYTLVDITIIYWKIMVPTFIMHNLIEHTIISTITKTKSYMHYSSPWLTMITSNLSSKYMSFVYDFQSWMTTFENLVHHWPLLKRHLVVNAFYK